MRKFTIILFILLVGCVDRPYNEAYFIGEGDDVIEPEDDVVESEEVTEEDVLEDTYEPEEDVIEDVVEDVIEPEEDTEEDIWVYDADAEDVVLDDADEDTWVAEDTYVPEDTWQSQDTYTPQDTWSPPKDTQQQVDTHHYDTKPKDTAPPPLGPGECPKMCASWYDGCNTCQCNDGKIGGCTKLPCNPSNKKDPYCKKLHGS